MKYTSQAQLLRDAADSIEMQEKAGIVPVYKHLNKYVQEISCIDYSYLLDEREFPLVVVEGKPVFVGDDANIQSAYMVKQDVMDRIQEEVEKRVRGEIVSWLMNEPSEMWMARDVAEAIRGGVK